MAAEDALLLCVPCVGALDATMSAQLPAESSELRASLQVVISPPDCSVSALQLGYQYGCLMHVGKPLCESVHHC